MNCPIMILHLKAINLRPRARLRWLRKELPYSRKHTDRIVSRGKRKVWRQDSDCQHGLPEKLATTSNSSAPRTQLISRNQELQMSDTYPGWRDIRSDSRITY